MKKILTLLLAILFIATSEAQVKDIKISSRDLSGYTPAVKQGLLSGSANETRPSLSPVQYHAMPAIRKNQFSGALSAEFMNDRPVLISGVISGSDTRNISSATYNYLLEAKKIMGVNDPINEFVNKSTIIDEQGNRHIKMQQVYNGIPLYGKEVILHEKRSQIESLNGQFASTPTDINTVPSVSIDDNKSLIKADIGHDVKDIDFEIPGLKKLEQWKEELIILPNAENGQFRLAYHTTVYVDISERIEYFVDAHTGEIIQKYGSLCKLHAIENIEGDHTHSHVHATIKHTEKPEKIANYLPMAGAETANAKDLFNNTVSINVYETGGNYYMIDASRSMYNAGGSNMPDEPKGTIWTIDAFNTSPQNSGSFSYDHVKSNNNNWTGNEGAVSAHYNGGKAYLYYKNVHNRSSIDGNGGNIVSLVNISDENGNSMGNAFWNGQAMFYGNGDNSFKPLARALDVAGHELTHGVVQSTANLVYQGEAGAINESMADIFGAMIDRDDWRIGEDVVKTNVFTSGALRDLKNPHNGQSMNDFGHGWQPKHVSEKYTGSQDNGGVHLNSGIANHAFYLFASDPKLGSSENARKQKAEKVYYKALSQYMTKSSQFVDLRIAVTRAAKDLYGADVENAAKNAFSAVGIGEGAGGNYETDYESNPGTEWLLVADAAKTKLILLDKDRVIWANPLSNTAPLSKPSVSDSGKDIVFVGTDKKIHLIQIDWGNTGTVNEIIFEDNPIWRNVVVSKDGTKLAALKDELSSNVEVYDDAAGVWNTMKFYNPTYTEGVSTGDVLFADALEFDPTGEWLMYDAKSEITSNSGSKLSYWDIGFLKVWDNANNTWGDEKVEKLFSALPDDISVGNPTYSKNSPYIIAFDYILGEENINIVGANLEKNKTGVIATDLFELGYPNYATSDASLVYDLDLAGFVDLNSVDLNSNKIDNVPSSDLIYVEGVRWGVYFSDGVRDLSGTTEIASNDQLSLDIVPNPVSDHFNLNVESIWSGKAKVNILDANGQLVHTEVRSIVKGSNTLDFDTSKFGAGMYVLQLNMKEGVTSKKLMKVK